MPKGQKLISLGSCATEYTCPVCNDYTTLSPTGIKLHIRKKHGRDFPVSAMKKPCCSVCDISFERKSQLMEHLRVNRCFEK